MENVKKEWQQLSLEILEVDQTMGGPNGFVPDKNNKGTNKGQVHDS
ncbi:hypothetical protein FHS18_000767 [Paenibacillus phyllosphaerae]|uniref:Paeninodin family lasso peptide n=1 Tax=Paenibacillus phyllosphaerae TaxID=274593 RepID=A0A7W5ATZ1_9BACL|nr:paeninodin family lasso peptide [Paenibacillus phyllosphaerae]MBB3108739.1 hypothetical protein [Paenibacillus phyllosphaerae]